MKPKTPKSEMPFLDHLEELRWRILWSLMALVVGTLIGFFLVQRYDVLALLKDPIAPYLPDGKLFVTRPTDAFLITLKLAVVIGAVLASPVIFAQVWRFLSPALYEHEKRYIVPSLIAGLGLFTAGVLMAYLWVLPAVFRILAGFQYEDLEWIITADAYFGFATQLILAFGIMFQLPLVMTLLALLDLVRPETFSKQRPIALVFTSIVAALLTPPDAFSMMMMMLPLLLLYEIGIIVGRLARRHGRPRGGAAAMVVLLLVSAAGTAEAQDPTQRMRMARDSARARNDSLARDSLAAPMDTAAARRLGLPSAPSRQFPEADSILNALLGREGYGATRYAGDSITLFGADREIRLIGSALLEREGSILEADSVRFQEADCRMLATGNPVLFDKGTVLVGEDMRYDTCLRRGTVPEAFTSLEQGGITWYLRGGLEMDSASTRIYGLGNEFTSCQEPIPHYHFSTGNVKWVSNTVMVARPAVLYVRDVPVMWLPFIFQDLRRGRRSGIMVPRFGFSDLVRPNESYRRHVSNIGYYFAISDYLDFQATLDWFAGNYVGVNGQLRYSWLNRFVNGGVAVSRIFEEGVEGLPGDKSLRLQWNHQQAFNQRTRLTADVDFATSSRVVQRNTIDPFVQTATLGSRINFSKQLDWGTLTVGGSRSQDLSNGTISQTLPSLSLTPSPIAVGTSFTWSPSLSFSNQQTLDQATGILRPRPPVGGVARFDTLLADTRNTSLSVRTPLRIGRWNWVNSLNITDYRTTRPPAPITLPDPFDPADSVTRYYGEDYRTGLDWDTGINLPILFASSWRLQPAIGIRNTSPSGEFLLRNRNTNGGFVSQGKRLAFSASVAPTLFGFFPGIGPIARIRHSVSPILNWSYSPAALVPDAYALAVDPTGRQVGRESPPLQRLGLSLTQTIEAKMRLPPGDTTDPARAPKMRLLSVQTSALEYDFEQAKQEGRNGWATQRISNQISSDLLPGFSFSTSVDLWDGPVGYDTTRLSPLLTSISTRFSVSGTTFAGILAVLTGGTPPPRDAESEDVDLEAEDPISPVGTGLGRSSNLNQNLGGMAPRGGGRGGFRADITFDDQRSRANVATAASSGREIGETIANRTLGLAVRFSPSRLWSVSWNTQYNMTRREFGQHVLRLDRDMHRWRATFAFLRAPNGNFAFNFLISLMDQPEIKFQYDQRSVQQGARGGR